MNGFAGISADFAPKNIKGDRQRNLGKVTLNECREKACALDADEVVSLVRPARKRRGPFLHHVFAHGAGDENRFVVVRAKGKKVAAYDQCARGRPGIAQAL